MYGEKGRAGGMKERDSGREVGGQDDVALQGKGHAE